MTSKEPNQNCCRTLNKEEALKKVESILRLISNALDKESSNAKDDAEIFNTGNVDGFEILLKRFTKTLDLEDSVLFSALIYLDRVLKKVEFFKSNHLYGLFAGCLILSFQMNSKLRRIKMKDFAKLTKISTRTLSNIHEELLNQYLGWQLYIEKEYYLQYQTNIERFNN